MADLNETPRANRIHIAFFGKTNAGKSTLVNAVAGREVSIVSDVAGTTTDPVYKAMELHPAGPVVLVDTAGLDDRTEIGARRIEKTRLVLDKTDVGVIVVAAGTQDLSEELACAQKLKQRGVPVLTVCNLFGKKDGQAAVKAAFPEYLAVDACSAQDVELVKQKIIEAAAMHSEPTLLDGLVKAGDVLALVMPQDIQAPKGRLILPQVQVLRDALDKGAKAYCVTARDLPGFFDDLRHSPDLVIVDSQIYSLAKEHVPRDVALTSFSVLMARQKGDIGEFVRGARAIDALKAGSRVLILEACAHHAQKGDIAREKLPRWLDEYAGGALSYTVVSGEALPADIRDYSLAVMCGACMHNRRFVLSRIETFRQAGVPLTNFGVAIAHLNGILDRIIC